jgi:hypothetical protein
MSKRNSTARAARALGLALALLAWGWPGEGSAASLTLHVTGGSTVSLTIGVTGVESLPSASIGAYDFDIRFDTSVLAFQSVSFLSPPDVSLRFFGEAGGVVDVAEVALVPTAILQDYQPDTFDLVRIIFAALTPVETLTSLTLTQSLVGGGAGERLTIARPLPIEVTAVIPEPGGVRTFALGLLVIVGGHLLRRR